MGTSLDRFVNEEPTLAERALARRDTVPRLRLASQQPTKPDSAQRILRMQMRTGLPPDIIERNLDQIEREAKRADFDPEHYRRTSPQVAEWLAENPARFTAVQDDLDRLAAIEATLRSAPALRGFLPSLGQGIGTGLMAGVSGAGHVMEAAGETGVGGPLPIPALLAPTGQAVQRFATRGREFFRPAVSSYQQIESILDVPSYLGFQAGQATGTMGSVLAGTLVGGPPGGLAASGTLAFGDIREELRELAPDQAAGTRNALALALTIPVAALDRVTPGQLASKLVTRGASQALVREAARFGLTRTVAREILKGAATEGGTELAQEMLQYLGTRAATDTEMSLAEAAPRAIDAMFGGLVGGGTFGTVSGAVEARRARQGRQAEAFFTAIGQATEGSKLIETLPEAVQEVIERMTAGGPVETVYAPIDTWVEYWQSKGSDPAVEAEAVLGNRTDYEQAVVTGADLAIPTARYAVTIAPSEHNAFFTKELRFSPDAMNAREAEAFATTMEQETTEQAAAARPAEESAARVAESVAQQLVGAGVPEDQARTYATVYEAAFRSLGERAGIDPEQLFQRYNVTVQREGLEPPAQPLGEGEFAQVAFHGTPHTFARFSTEAIGTGEGAQAFGWGLYFAGNREVAEYYRNTVTSDEFAALTEEENAALSPFERNYLASNPDRIGLLISHHQNAIDTGRGGVESQAAVAALTKLREAGDASLRKGRLYKVDIPDDETYLNWNRPLSKQPEPVRRTLEEAGLLDDDKIGRGAFGPPVTGETLYRYLQARESARLIGGSESIAAMNVSLNPETGAEAASRYLASLGISGIRYLDQGSRDKRKGSYNYVVFDDQAIQVLELEQRAEGAGQPRGRIRISPEGVRIDLLADADLSTFLHETAHFYMQVLADLAMSADPPADIARDYATVREWLGAGGDAPLTREQHEQFARGFEAYLMEGKAPNAALRSAFARFRAWLVSVYRSLANLQSLLSDDVRGVFDRLLATDEEIEAATAEADAMPLFDDMAAIPERFRERYSQQVEKARNAATEELSSKLIAQYRRESSAVYQAERERVRAEVAQAVNQEPASIALAALARGTLPDGSDLPAETAALLTDDAGKRVKLSRQALVDAYGEDYLKSLPRPYVYQRAGGLPLEVAAELFGFDSADAMLRAIKMVEPGKRRIERLTDERMTADFDLLASPELAEEAMKAVQNEERATLLRLEMEILASQDLATLKGITERVILRMAPTEAMRAEARRIIARLPVREIRPATYLRAAVRARKAARAAWTAGDLRLAVAEVQRESFAEAMRNAAQQATDEVDRIVNYMQTFERKATRERLGKAGADYLEQIDAIRERFDFRRSIGERTLDRRQSLLAFVRQQEKAGLPVDIPESLIDEARRQHYRTLPLEELTGIRDAVKQIEHLARLKNKLVKAKRTRELDEAAALASSSIIANAKGRRPSEPETRLPGTERGRQIAEFVADHRKYASLLRQMDGLVDGGPLWELLVRPINEAANEEAVLNERAATEFRRIFGDQYTPGDLARMYDKQVVPGTTVSLTKMGRLMVALNWGNEINRRRVLEGYASKGWTLDTVQRILDTLDERDWTFVRETWSHLQTYWPALEALGRELHGVPPTQVEASPFETRFGTMPGGYFPIAFDDRQSQQAHAFQADRIADRIRRGAAVRSRTAQGMLEERVEGAVRMPVRLDFGVIFEHVGEVIHTITHTAPLMDVSRILAHEQVRDAIYDHYGDLTYKGLAKTLEDVTTGDLVAQTGFEKSLGWLRQGATITGLGWSVMTSVLQPFGLANSMVRIGPKWVLRGLSRWIGDAARLENTVAEVHRRSDFMRLRHKTMQREINEIRNTIGLSRGKVSGWIDEALRVTTGDGVTRHAIADSYFRLITAAQMIADVPTWLGQYEKRIAHGDDEQTAVALADQAVLDSQGGGQIKDLAEIQRGSALLKVWTNFYSYFNVVYNQLAESRARTNFRHPMEVGRFAVDVLLLITLPSVLGTVAREVLRPGDDDEDESFALRLAKEQGGYALGLMVGFREFGGTFLGYYGYEGPAGVRFFSEASKLYQQITQWEWDPALWKALNETAGILLHYPAAQVNRTVAGIAAIVAGDTRNPLAVIFGPSRD